MLSVQLNCILPYCVLPYCVLLYCVPLYCLLPTALLPTINYKTRFLLFPKEGLPSNHFCIKPTFLLVAYYFDELIVSEIRKKNEIVLQELYKTHYAMIVHLVCSNSGTEQEAKDIYQEAVMAFYERVQQPTFVLTCKIKTYLYAVCRRLWLKKLAEKKRLGGDIDELETFLGLEEELAHIDQKEKRLQRMGTALNGLGEPCRSIIEDFYMKDLSMEDISTKFGYTNADNAKNQKYKCLQRLKKLFFEDYKEE
jgi:RNA polymerase sigma factor (sigma-70 family)